MTITNSENSTLTLKVWTLGSQKVSSTVNKLLPWTNAKHPSKTSYFLFFGSQFGSFWGLTVWEFLTAKSFFGIFWVLRFRKGWFRLVELDLFEFVILSVWETIVEQIRFTWNSLLSCVNTGATFSPKLYDFQQK